MSLDVTIQLKFTSSSHSSVPGGYWSDDADWIYTEDNPTRSHVT